MTRSAVVRGIVVLTIVAVALIVGPRPVAPSQRTTGDAALAQRVRDAIGPRPGTSALAVAVITPDTVRTAGLGQRRDGAAVDAETAFEIGSVTKALTGMLLAALQDAGDVRIDERLARTSDLPQSAPIADATPIELAQHRSGLPRLALGGPVRGARAVFANLTGGNPYAGWTAQEIVAATTDRELDGRGEYAYSNLGFGLLGSVVDRSLGRSYPTVLRERILQPLGMAATIVVADTAQLPDGRASGTTLTGFGRDPWIGPGYAAAGVGVWSTVSDMAAVVQAVADGSAPGADAAQPRVGIGPDQRIGLGWVTERLDDREITWHNGGTGGFSSWIGFDREARRGVAVLSASDVRVDQLGEHLLGVAPSPAARGWTMPDIVGIVLLAVLMFAALGAASAARTAARGRLDSRLAGIESMSEPVAMLVLTWVLGPWLAVPWWLWSVVAAGCAVAAVVVAVAASRQPWIADDASRWRVTLRVGHIVVVLALVALIVL